MVAIRNSVTFEWVDFHPKELLFGDAAAVLCYN